MTRVVALAVTALVCGLVALVAGAATRSASGCSAINRYCDPGELPAGVYTTRYFLPGMRVTLPGGGWSSAQDSTDEFKLSPPGYPANDSSPLIRFWIDPHAGTPCSDKVLPVDMTTPARAVRWLRANKNFVVSAPRRTLIAGHLPALSVDLDVSRTAPRCSSTCPGPCFDFFLFYGGAFPSPDLAPGHTPGVTEVFGGSPVRFSFAAIGPPSHVLTVGVETPKREGFVTVNREAATLLAHLRLPAKLPSKQR